MSAVDVALPRLESEEGFRALPYLDTNGLGTIGRLDMNPCLPLMDAANRLKVNSVLSREASQGGGLIRSGAYLPHGICRQLGARVRFTKVQRWIHFCAVLEQIGLIRLMRVPAQIAYHIVGRVAVVVAALHSLRARTHECQKHEPVNLLRTGSHAIDTRIDEQADYSAALVPARDWLEKASFDAFPNAVSSRRTTVNRPNQSGIACLVAGESWDISPFHRGILT